jgi:hypothetical protein
MIFSTLLVNYEVVSCHVNMFHKLFHNTWPFSLKEKREMVVN